MGKKVSYLLIIFIIFLAGYFLGHVSESIDYVDNYDLDINDSNLNLSDDFNYTNNSKSTNATKYASNNQVKNNSKYEFEGICTYVVDGDTIDVEGIGRIRFVGVNTPERGEEGYKSAKEFVKSKCLGKTVYLDIDNKKNKDKYQRTLAVVYTENDENLNQLLLKGRYAEIMYIPPSEFYPYDWQ